ncbi:MAG: Na+/H+ antiporter NhaA, partial [Saprospiraceae bacterium]
SLTPLQQLENILHPIVAFVIMPIFALVNAGITFDGRILEELNSPVTYGIILGLVIGKFIGVTGVVRVLTWFNWCKLPEGVSWSQIVGIGFIAGIGFTMSLFINNLAFSDPLLISRAKTGILFASIISGVIGFIILYRSGKPTRAR